MAANQRLQKGDGPKLTTGKLIAQPSSFKTGPKAPFLDRRLQVWDRLYQKHQENLAKEDKKPIQIELPDGNKKAGVSFETTPLSIAEGISKKLAEQVMVAKVYYKEEIKSLQQCVAADDDEVPSEDEGSDEEEETEVKEFVLWDLTRPLEGSCKLELLKFDDKLGSDTFWHSSAHVLGCALEQEYGCHLTIGPPLAKGFYYDMYVGDKKISVTDDLPKIEKKINEVVKQNDLFQRCVLTKDDALELFKDNPFKVQLITNKVPDGSLTSAYRCGPLIDLCRGPHLPSTGRAKAFWVNKNSSAYWLGKAENDTLQRIYATAFPSEKELKVHKVQMEEAAKRDHRAIGLKQDLYFFHDFSAGSCFWMPHGARIFNKLIQFMRREYDIRGFQEVITPNLYHESLFKASGHFFQYNAGMYNMDIEGEKWFLKPMNCPGHCVVFKHRVRSYKELPLRMASFGVLHRNELSGSLSGLTRVRRFQQDDAHIFCRPDQITEEVQGALEFVKYIYDVFGLKFSILLSTRPKKAIGTKEQWKIAEDQLAQALNNANIKFDLNKGDGAFYGPKIDIVVSDCLGRTHQCATIQLDFQLPMRFNLQYQKKPEHEGADEKPDAPAKVEKQSSATGADGAEAAMPSDDAARAEILKAKGLEGKIKAGFERPVMVHRAIFGSLERFTAILCEHFGGKWPFFLSPRQVLVVPTHAGMNEYCEWLAKQYQSFGIYAEADLSSKTMNKKVREGQVAQYNYVAVCGEKEQEGLSVNLRDRDTGRPIGMMSVSESVQRMMKENNPNSAPANTFSAFQGRVPESLGGSSSSSGTPAAGEQKIPNSAAPANGVAPAEKGADKKKAPADKKNWDQHFAEFTYVEGYARSAADASLFAELKGAPAEKNFARWYAHMNALKLKGEL